jgi:hypothetical protein
MENKIIGIRFKRKKKWRKNRIILHMEGHIPEVGLSVLDIIEMLLKFRR